MLKKLLSDFFLIFALFGLLFFSYKLARADVSKPLTIKGQWVLESAIYEPANGLRWIREDGDELKRGGAFIQLKAEDFDVITGCIVRHDPMNSFCKRLKLIFEKPADKVCELAIQFPNRTQKHTYPAGSSKAIFTLNEISLKDAGQMGVFMTCEGAVDNTYGLIVINTYKDEIKSQAVSAVTFNGKELQDGDKIKKGWWFLFFGSAKKVGVVVPPIDLLSLCVYLPDGMIECSDTNLFNFRAKKKGWYFFVAWNTFMQSSVIAFEAT
jgi:hypothetical protein